MRPRQPREPYPVTPRTVYDARYTWTWDTDDAKAIASRYLSECGERWDHVQAVGAYAEELHADAMVSETVVVAAWLHDIGYASALISTGFHPVDGADFLAHLGAPRAVVALVAHHSGAEYEARERGLLHVLRAYPRPSARDLDWLTLVDLSVSPQGQIVTPQSRIAEILERYEPGTPVHQAITRSREHLLLSVSRAQQRQQVRAQAQRLAGHPGS